MGIAKIAGYSIILGLQLSAAQILAGGAAPPDGRWDPTKPNKCSFACKEIPPDSQVLRHFSDGTQDTIDGSHFRVVAWNLYKGRMKNFRPDFLKLMGGADVIMASEATDGDLVKPVFTSLQGFGWDFATSFLMKANVATGVAIGSKAKVQEVQFSRTDDLEPYVKSPKAIVMGTYGIPGTDERLLVVSIHGINWNDDQALGRQLTKVLPVLQAHKGPVVFAGDFNTKNQIRLELSKEVLGKAGLTRVNWENPESGKQLDDAFTRGLTVHHARLVQDYVGDGSDHPAIDLDVSYVGASASVAR